MTLAELLAQADLPSELTLVDLVAKLGDKGKDIKLADFRGLHSSVESEKQRLNTEVKKAEEIGKEAQGLLAALKTAVDEQAKNAGAPKVDDKKNDWRKNPLYEELVPVFEGLETLTKQADARAAAATKALTQISAFYSLERMRSEYNAAPENFRKATPFEKVVEEALRNGEVVTFGEGDAAIKMPTLSKRIREGTESDRIAAAVAEATKKINADWEQKTRMAAGSGKAGGSAKFTTQKAKESPIKKLDELTSEAVQTAMQTDPDFAKAMEGEPV